MIRWGAVRNGARKGRGSLDRRGMGAQSDFISETFVPGDGYKAEQRARAKVLLASGIPRVEVAAMLSIALEGFERELIEDGNAATTRLALGLDGALPAPELGSLR